MHDTVKELIAAAINYLEHNRKSVIKDIYFLALTDRQRDACLGALKNADVDSEALPQSPLQA